MVAINNVMNVLVGSVYCDKIVYTGGINNRDLFLKVLQAGKSKIKAWEIPFLVRALCLASRYLQTVSPRGGERRQALVTFLYL